MRFKDSILLLIIFLQLPVAKAQENHLNKKITLTADQWRIASVLTAIEKQGEFYFSYDSELIPSDSLVSVSVFNESVESVLKQVLPIKSEFKSVGNHLVIYKAVPEKKEEILISGYVRDKRNNQPIVNATLYDPQHNLMATSDGSGYYELSVSARPSKIGLMASKSGYRQEVIYIVPKETGKQDFNLSHIEKPLEGLAVRPMEQQDVNDRKIVQLVVPQRILDNSENLTLYEKSALQFSLIPGISTNGLLNGNSINRFSFNLLSGYSKGTEGVELGGLVNINRNDMKGLQLAGLANVTGQSMIGLQFSGMFNYNGSLFEGAQISGMSNVNGGDMKGLQMAGFSNYLKGKMNGVQLAGFTNITTQNVDGLQGAGFLNITMKDVKTAQLSGFMNYSRNIQGAQLTGFSNVATGEVKGTQMAGFVNYAQTLDGLQMAGFGNLTNGINRGTQISGFFNYARDNSGYQLSVFNYADTSSGIPFGFLSIVKKGYHTLEIAAEEVFFINAAFRTGVPLFYNIFGLGIGQDHIQYTYGLGTMPSLGNKLKISLDLSGSMVFNSSNPNWEDQGYMFRFIPSVHYQFTPKFGLALGPTLNYFHTELSADGTTDKLSLNPIFENTADGFYEQAWIGGRLALRFF